MEKIWETRSAAETAALGRCLGEQALPGQIYCLSGDLGTGKTVLTKGFAAGLGIQEHITSPTFTIVNEYHDGKMPFYHFDVYRLCAPEELEEIGFEEYLSKDGVCLVEWAELFTEWIPSDAIWITVEKDFAKGEDYRKVTMRQEEKA